MRTMVSSKQSSGDHKQLVAVNPLCLTQSSNPSCKQNQCQSPTSPEAVLSETH